MLRLLLPLLASLSGHYDEPLLNHYADSLNVPREVVWAVAWQESRDGRKGNRYTGQGIVLDNGVHICREIGRMQLSPCGPWTKGTCSPVIVRRSYSANVRCGVLALRKLYERFGSWSDAIYHYNGSRTYLQNALAYIGGIRLKELRL